MNLNPDHDLIVNYYLVVPGECGRPVISEFIITLLAPKCFLRRWCINKDGQY